MKNLLKIFRYVIPYWWYIILNMIFNLLSVVFSVFSLTMVIPFLGLLFGTVKLVYHAPPLTFNSHAIIENFYYYISKIIVIYGKNDALLFICIVVVVLFLLKNMLRYLAMYFVAPIRGGVIMDIRNQIYKKILILPLSYYIEKRKGDIMSRISNDVQEVEWTIMSSLVMIIRDPLTIIIYLVTLFVISFKLTIFVVVLFPVAGFIIGAIGKRLKKKSFLVQKIMGVILSVVEETISGLRIIKAFGAIDIFEKKFKQTNGSYSRLIVNIYRRRDLAAPLSEFMGTFVMVVIMLIGGNMVLSSDNNLSAEVFMFFILTFSQLIVPAKSFTDAYYNIQKGVVSFNRIQEVIEAEEVIEEKPDALSIKEFRDNIEYRNVLFAYSNKPVLKDVNLKIDKGKIIALVGESGGGKTTLVDLLPRFYDCTSGEILLDGVSIKDYKIDDIRSMFGIVSKESILFNDTVFNNIAFGNTSVTEEQVIEAAKVANAHDFIEKMTDGYYTNIGDRGAKLSGGQKQRICIARAVLKNPPILILDEATSSLDTESERLVQDALSKLMKNRTSIVIAHRLSTVQFADEIIVIRNGSIVERGTHLQLIALDKAYKKMFDLQKFS